MSNFAADLLRRTLPESIKTRIKSSRLYLKDRAGVDNVYHCCTHKSASQWVRALLADPLTFRYSGLRPFHYQTEWAHWLDNRDPRPFNERYFSSAFPRNTVVSPLYIPYPCYADIDTPGAYRAFFVMRDPRDVIVSWYFSMKHSHPLIGGVGNLRDELQNRTHTEGLCWYIERLTQSGFYDLQRSWARCDDDTVLVIRYEDLTGPEQFAHARALFDHCQIPLPDDALREVLDRHSFSKKSGGRQKGEGDVKKHYRKGKAGDWKDHFDHRVTDTFLREAGTLAEDLGYTPTEDHQNTLSSNV